MMRMIDMFLINMVYSQIHLRPSMQQIVKVFQDVVESLRDLS